MESLEQAPTLAGVSRGTSDVRPQWPPLGAGLAILWGTNPAETPGQPDAVGPLPPSPLICALESPWCEPAGYPGYLEGRSHPGNRRKIQHDWGDYLCSRADYHWKRRHRGREHDHRRYRFPSSGSRAASVVPK